MSPTAAFSSLKWFGSTRRDSAKRLRRLVSTADRADVTANVSADICLPTLHGNAKAASLLLLACQQRLAMQTSETSHWYIS